MSENIKKGISPKFFFLSLGIIISLITSVITSLSLFFETLEKKLPDILNASYEYGYTSYSFENMRTMIATLIIIFPIFLILSLFWKKDIKKGLIGKDISVFKWTIYIILFLASIVIAIDLVVLVKYFVSGEITNRFIYKVLGTAIVSGIIWAYYFISLKDLLNKNKLLVKRILFISSIIIFFGLISFGFLIMGSPKKQRAYRLDERRISDLQNLQWQIINYWQQKNKLPENINSLKDPLNYNNIPLDPEFQKGKKYEYFIKGDLSFELCATFSAERTSGFVENNDNTIYQKEIYNSAGNNLNNDVWYHDIGRNCFLRNIDTDIYKLINEKNS